MGNWCSTTTAVCEAAPPEEPDHWLLVGKTDRGYDFITIYECREDVLEDVDIYKRDGDITYDTVIFVPLKKHSMEYAYLCQADNALEQNKPHMPDHPELCYCFEKLCFARRYMSFQTERLLRSLLEDDTQHLNNVFIVKNLIRHPQ